jgi:hypothetical protein
MKNEKETTTKLLIIVLSLFVIFDPTIEKVKHGKKYLHSLFVETFNDDQISISSIKKVARVDSSENALR